MTKPYVLPEVRSEFLRLISEIRGVHSILSTDYVLDELDTRNQAYPSLKEYINKYPEQRMRRARISLLMNHVGAIIWKPKRIGRKAWGISTIMMEVHL